MNSPQRMNDRHIYLDNYIHNLSLFSTLSPVLAPLLESALATSWPCLSKRRNTRYYCGSHFRVRNPPKSLFYMSPSSSLSQISPPSTLKTTTVASSTSPQFNLNLTQVVQLVTENACCHDLVTLYILLLNNHVSFNYPATVRPARRVLPSGSAATGTPSRANHAGPGQQPR